MQKRIKFSEIKSQLNREMDRWRWYIAPIRLRFMGLCKLYIRRFITAVARAGRKWMGVLDGIGMAMVNLSHVSLSWHLVTFVGDESQKGRRNGVWRHSDVFIWRKNVQVKQVKTNLQTIAKQHLPSTICQSYKQQ